MNFSLNEVEATARKAARGAGYAWGMADETGKAVRWLCANGVDGCAAMAVLLQQVDGRDLRSLTPDVGAIDWAAKGPFLCPITAGCALADQGRTTVQFETLVAPILVLPFLAHVARSQGVILHLMCNGGSAKTDGYRLCLYKTVPDQGAAALQISPDFGAPYGQVTRVSPRKDDWATLNTFAHRTYAPATEESRLKGAG